MKWKLFLTIAFILTLAVPSWATTYYVAKGGSDSYSGTSWQAAWESLTKVNGTVQGGDTVFFGTGTWRGQLIPPTGSSSDRTCYACSSFAETNGAGEYHFAKIWGSDSATSWTQIGSSNVYRTTSRGYTGFTAGYQGDSVLWMQADSASVNAPGEFWTGAGRIIAYAYNQGRGYDPDYYDMEFSQTNPIIDMANTGSYTTLYGLEIKYASTRCIDWGGQGGDDVDGCYIEHCKISHAYGYAGVNPSLIHSYNQGSDSHDYNILRACSLGYAWSYYPTPADEDGSHGCATTFYRPQYILVESCNVYGYFSFCGLHFKNDGGPIVKGNVVRYNTFDNFGGIGIQLYNYIYGFQVYGNFFKEVSTPCRVNITSSDTCGYIEITNNTFYNCRNTYSSRNVYTDGYRQKFVNVKYNVSYNDDDLELSLRYDDSSQVNGWNLDSNLYYAGGSTVLSTGAYSTYQTYSVTNWRSLLHHDERSVFGVNPGFANPEAGDLSRPSASNEMNVAYGGRVWTIYGAWQPGDPTTEIDITPPATIFDLGALPGDEHGEMTVSWTAAGDDLWDGTARRYEVMWSLEPITEGIWIPMLTSYDCVAGGSRQETTISGLEAGREYYVAVKTYDEYGLVSGISNSAESFAGGITTPPAALTIVDEGSGTATLSCGSVTSYYDPLTYDFALTDSGSIDTNVINVSAVVDGRVSAVFTDLSASSSYYWRYRAVAEGLDASDWSISRKFRLSNVAPEPPTLSQPADFDTVIATSGSAVTMTVNCGYDDDGPEALTYQFELYDITGTNRLASESDIADQDSVVNWESPIQLPSDQYSWRARCYDGLDYSPWMDFAHFRVVSFGANLTDDYIRVFAFPNPVRFTEGQEITFRLPETPVDLFIQTVSGETVLLKTEVSGDWTWNGENASGNTVSVGIYLWYVRGTDQHGKIVVKP